jgi:hypothetical protein
VSAIVSLTGLDSTIFPTFVAMCLQTQVFAGEVKDLEWDSESKRIVAVGESQGTVRVDSIQQIATRRSICFPLKDLHIL